MTGALLENIRESYVMLYKMHNMVRLGQVKYTGKIQGLGHSRCELYGVLCKYYSYMCLN